MKASPRKEKLLALQAAINGHTDTLRRYRQNQPELIEGMVVYSVTPPSLTDLVDTR
jgi:hypothetical protein